MHQNVREIEEKSQSIFNPSSVYGEKQISADSGIPYLQVLEVDLSFSQAVVHVGNGLAEPEKTTSFINSYWARK